MFGIKKKGRAAASKFHESVGGIVSNLLYSLRKRTRFDGRMRIANRWAKKHPRKLAVIYGTFAVFLLSLNIAEFFLPKNEEKKDESSNIDNYYHVANNRSNLWTGYPTTG